MIKELMMKWFGLSEPECKTCQVLQRELDICRREKEILLGKLINKEEPVINQYKDEGEMKPLPGSRRFMASAVRQQLIEKEDARTLEIMKKRTKEIDEIEKELGIAGESKEEKANAS